MPFIETLPEWNNTGVEPTQTKKDNGWAVGEKPPASAFNWLQYTAFQSLQELQQYAVHNEDFGDISNLTTTDKTNMVNAVNEVNAQLTEATLTQTLTEPINVLDSDRVTDLILKAFTGQTNVNHVPLFDSGLWLLHANVTVDSPSKITLNASGTWESSSIRIKAKPNTTYTFSLDHNSIFYYREYDSSGTQVFESATTGSQEATFTTQSTTEEIGLFLSNNSTGTYTFENVMLNEGSTAQAFTKNVRPIKNPVLFSKGKNLFDIHSVDLHANAELTDSRTITHDNTSGSSEYSETFISVKPNTNYTISPNGLGDNNFIQFVGFEEDKNTTTGLQFSRYDDVDHTFTTDSTTKALRVRFFTDIVGTFTFSDIMLVVGDSTQLPSEYVAYNPSYLVLKSSFYAGDQPYQDPNGNWRKLAEKKEMALDGSLGWISSTDYTGYKRVEVPISNFIALSEKVVKHDGSIIQSQDSGGFTQSDQSYLGSGSLYLSLSDSDTGFTESMSPTSDQISAIFNGWIYTGDGTTHSWENYYDSADTTTDVNVCLSRNTHEENGEEGYRLVYELDTKEDVAIESEGSLQLHEGLNQVEMAESLVVREENSPKSFEDEYFINNNNLNSSLSRKSLDIRAIYKNGELDEKWRIEKHANAYGDELARINNVDYDPTAQYTVSYLALRYQLSAPIDNVDVQFNKSMISVQQGLVNQTTDNTNKLSVLSSQKADKHQEQWKEPTLLNGATQQGTLKVGYMKDDFNSVRLRGAVNSISVDSVVFILPKGYRPLTDETHVTAGYDTSWDYCIFTISANGEVKVRDAANTWVGLDGISFQAEQ